jgi:hypothetical protein
MEYTLGAIKNPKDLRDIQLAQVQQPVSVPFSFKTDISMIPVMSQLNNGSCVGHAHALIHIYNELKENHTVSKLSPRYLYALSKKIDGYEGQGTYPRITAKIQVDKGCASETYIPCMDTLSHAEYVDITEEAGIDAKQYKMKGYAFIPSDKEALKQAIIQNGLVAVTISVGNYDNPIKKGDVGFHRVVVFGYEGDKFFFRNSWGNEWGIQGDGYFDWNNQQVTDCMVFVDLPNEVKEEAKKKYKYFNEKESYNVSPDLMKILDQAREIAGVPFPITSGFRTKEQNEKAGGVPNSAHTKGLAVDIQCTDNIKRQKMLWGLMHFRDKLFIEIAGRHLHIDMDSSIHAMGSVYWGNDPT